MQPPPLPAVLWIPGEGKLRHRSSSVCMQWSWGCWGAQPSHRAVVWGPPCPVGTWGPWQGGGGGAGPHSALHPPSPGDTEERARGRSRSYRTRTPPAGWGRMGQEPRESRGTAEPPRPPYPDPRGGLGAGVSSEQRGSGEQRGAQPSSTSSGAPQGGGQGASAPPRGPLSSFPLRPLRSDAR